MTMIEVIYAFGVLFSACEHCQRLNCAFNECNDMIVQFEWYSLSAEVQRMLPFIIHYAQQPVDVKCFDSTACDRETFKSVSSIKPVLLFDRRIVSLQFINSLSNTFHRLSGRHIHILRYCVNFICEIESIDSFVHKQIRNQ